MSRDIETIPVEQQLTMLNVVADSYGRYVRRGKYQDNQKIAIFEERELERHVGYLDPRPDYIQLMGERLLQRVIQTAPIAFDATNHFGTFETPRYEREFYTKEAGHFAPIHHLFFAKIALSKTIELTDTTSFYDDPNDPLKPDGSLLFSDVENTVYTSFDAIAARVSHTGRHLVRAPTRAS